MDKIETKVTEFLAKEFKVAPQEVKREGAFEDHDIDSLDVQELIFSIEDEMGIDIDPGDIEGVKNIGDFIDVVIAKVKSKPAVEA